MFDRLATFKAENVSTPQESDMFDQLASYKSRYTPDEPQVTPKPSQKPTPAPDMFDRLALARGERVAPKEVPTTAPIDFPIQPPTGGGFAPETSVPAFDPQAEMKRIRLSAEAPYKTAIAGVKGALDIGVGIASDTAQFAAMAPIGVEAIFRAGFTGADEAAEVVAKRQEAVQEFIGYTPRTKMGKKGMAGIHKLFGIFAEAGEYWGEKMPGGAYAQTAVHTFFEGLPVLLGGKGALKKAGRRKKAGPEMEAVVAEAGKVIEKKIDMKKLEQELLPEGKAAKAALEEKPVGLSKDAQKAWDTFEKSKAESEALGRTTLKKRYRDLKAALVDKSGNVKTELRREGRAGKEAVAHQEMRSGASDKIKVVFEEATKDIYGGLTKGERKWLDSAINSRNTIAIDKFKTPKTPAGLTQLGFPKKASPIKHAEGLTSKEHMALLDEIPVGVKSKLMARTDRFFAETRSQLDQLLTEGLISKKEHTNLIARGDYAPRVLLKYVDPEAVRMTGGTTKGSGLKALKEGDFGLMESNSLLLLEEVVSRTQKRIFENRANRALYELIKTVPENKTFRMSKTTGVDASGRAIYEKAPAGHGTVNVMIDGVNKEMLMPKELVREWGRQEPAMSRNMAEWVGILSGTKVLKAMATGLNPEFAVSNLFRDMARALIVTEEFSPHLPVGVAQLVKDMAIVLPDVIKKKGRWRAAIDEGLGMGSLTRQGRLISSTKSIAGKANTVMGYLGETSEMAVRLAIRERAIRNGKSSFEASHIARSQMDFAQGGSYVKAADKAIPYLNAATQGTRGYFTAAHKNPKLFTYKMAQVGGLAMGLYYLNKTKYSSAYAEVPDRHKVANHIIMTPFTYHDKDGNKRQFYIVVPKDQGQRIVSTLFENVMAKSMGEEVSDIQLVQAMEDFLPLVPTGIMPPTLDAIVGYTANKDLYRNQDIWKGTRGEIEESEEYYPEGSARATHPFFVKAGQAADVSPERLKYALSQYFTTGNVYTSMAGGGWNEIFENLSEEEREAITEELILKKPFIRKLLKSTHPYNAYGNELKEEAIRDNTEKWLIDRDFNVLSQGFYDGKVERQAVVDFIRNAPMEEQKRLMSRHKSRGRIQGLPNKNWWMSMGGLKAETRAAIYWNKWRTEDSTGRKDLESQLRRAPGITSKRFYRKLRELKKTDLQEG